MYNIIIIGGIPDGYYLRYNILCTRNLSYVYMKKFRAVRVTNNMHRCVTAPWREGVRAGDGCIECTTPRGGGGVKDCCTRTPTFPRSVYNILVITTHARVRVHVYIQIYTHILYVLIYYYYYIGTTRERARRRNAYYIIYRGGRR